MAKLSVIIPVYNEGKHLEEVLTFLFHTPCSLEREWIVVDDFSTDDSREVLKKLRQSFEFHLIEHSKNRGKGAAIQSAISYATGDFVMIQDADFEYDPSDIPSLLAPLLTNHADVVYGSRFRQSVSQVHRTYHYFVNRLLTTMSNLFSGMYLTDMETCYKIFRSEILKSMKLKSERFGIEIELTAYIAKTSARIYELPIHYYPRTRLQGKKITWKDGIAALFHLIRFNYFENLETAFSNLPKKYQQPGVMQRHLLNLSST